MEKNSGSSGKKTGRSATVLGWGHPVLIEAIDDAGLGQIVGRHFELHAVAGGQADETLAHLAGDVREDLMAVGQLHPKHGARQHLGDGSG